MGRHGRGLLPGPHIHRDSTKSLCADDGHRILRNLWAANEIVVPISGHTIENAGGHRVNVKDLCERDHLLPDYADRFIPTLGDFVTAMGEVDTSHWRARIGSFHADFAGDPAMSELMLSPLAATGRQKSLLVTHNSWFVNRVLPRLFPSAPRIVEFDISPDDVFGSMRSEAWMDNGADAPPSAARLRRLRVGRAGERRAPVALATRTVGRQGKSAPNLARRKRKAVTQGRSGRYTGENAGKLTASSR